MVHTALKTYLQKINHSKEQRALGVDRVLNESELLPKLIAIASQTEEPIAIKALWLLEFVCRKNVMQIAPYIKALVDLIQRVKHDSAIRPAAKICEMIMLDYYGKSPNNTLKTALTLNYRNAIADQCFDWLIDPKNKVAPKAYSMTTLFLLGTEISWIHEELYLQLEHHYERGSAAYKARSRHIFEKIKKHKRTLS